MYQAYLQANKRFSTHTNTKSRILTLFGYFVRLFLLLLHIRETFSSFYVHCHYHLHLITGFIIIIAIISHDNWLFLKISQQLQNTSNKPTHTRRNAKYTSCNEAHRAACSLMLSFRTARHRVLLLSFSNIITSVYPIISYGFTICQI